MVKIQYIVLAATFNTQNVFSQTYAQNILVNDWTVVLQSVCLCDAIEVQNGVVLYCVYLVADFTCYNIRIIMIMCKVYLCSIRD